MTTTKALAEIKRLHGEGKHDYEIAELLGLNSSTIRYWRMRLGLPKVKRYYRSVRMKEYIVYDGKDEVLVAMGTAKECAKALGISENTFRSSMSKAKSGKYRKYSFCEVNDS